MNIQPLGNIIQLEFEEAKAGVLDTSSRESAVERATVVGISEDATFSNVKVGDKVFVKAWAVDIVTHEDKKYYFVNPETGGILAKVE